MSGDHFILAAPAQLSVAYRKRSALSTMDRRGASVALILQSRARTDSRLIESGAPGAHPILLAGQAPSVNTSLHENKLKLCCTEMAQGTEYATESNSVGFLPAAAGANRFRRRAVATTRKFFK